MLHFKHLTSLIAQTFRLSIVITVGNNVFFKRSDIKIALKVFFVPAEVASEIGTAISDLSTTMESDNIDDIKFKLDAANNAVSKIGQHMSGCPSQGGDQQPEADYEQ
ncbi:hypothetical protein FRX31_019636, partial [Thalictrum thalictroides]